MKDIKKQIEELLRRKVKNCKNSTAIFDTKDYVLLDDVIDDVTKILSQYVSDTTFADAYRAIVHQHRWRKASEELPPVNELVVVRVRNKNKPDGIYLYDVCYIDEETNFWGDRLHTWEDITAWKPIN